MNHSSELFNRASRLIPGGVNSPVRAFKGVGGNPIFFKQGRGAYLTDVDDKQYIDYVGSWGPLILGHCHPGVIDAVGRALHQGMSFGAPTELELSLAQQIITLMPNIEKIRMVNSGTEATMTAIRLARGYTKKNKIIKFNGCYHGHSDSLLVKAGSGLLTLGIPSTPGIPESITQHTLVVDFNDLEHTTRLFEAYGDDIAAVINEKNRLNGLTALMCAATGRDDPALIQSLLDKGANPAAKDFMGRTALSIAHGKGNVKMTALLERWTPKSNQQGGIIRRRRQPPKPQQFEL